MGLYSKPIEELIARLTYHASKDGKLLDKVNVSDVPTLEVDGKDNLPAMRLYVPDIDEKHRPGQPAKASLTLKLTVASARSEGIVAHMKLVERALDAIEVTEAGAIDSKLNGSLRRPYDVKTADAIVQDTSITSQLMLTLFPRKTPQRGKRRTL